MEVHVPRGLVHNFGKFWPGESVVLPIGWCVRIRPITLCIAVTHMAGLSVCMDTDKFIEDDGHRLTLVVPVVNAVSTDALRCTFPGSTA